MLTPEQKNQFSEILEELGKTLDISESLYNSVVKSYEAVGDWLAKEDSSLAPYEPKILPQGSFMIGTMIKPVIEGEDLDIDLVCLLKGKNPNWTQYDLKNKVGTRLKNHEIYRNMLDEEGRRCWTLTYSDIANYHMDVLPSIVSHDYKIVQEHDFSASELNDFDKLAIRITCTDEINYKTEPNPDEWLKSNPFGYARWFLERAEISSLLEFSSNKSIKPIPAYSKDKLPLLRVVQILKRHRDMMFNGHEHKPISILITTLAAKAYNKETNIIDALLNVVQKMPQLIEERDSPKHAMKIKWVSNPVNKEENFADRWLNETKREENFYKWMHQVKIDIDNATNKRGLQYIQESLEKPFGKQITTQAFSNYGANELKKRESNNLRMASKTGMLGGVGAVVKNHNFFGTDEE